MCRRSGRQARQVAVMRAAMQAADAWLSAHKGARRGVGGRSMVAAGGAAQRGCGALQGLHQCLVNLKAG